MLPSSHRVRLYAIPYTIQRIVLLLARHPVFKRDPQTKALSLKPTPGAKAIASDLPATAKATTARFGKMPCAIGTTETAAAESGVRLDPAVALLAAERAPEIMRACHAARMGSGLDMQYLPIVI